MTVADLPVAAADRSHAVPQRFVFDHVDWAFYEEVGRHVEGGGTFVTFYKGRLEIVTTSLLHEQISNLLSIMVGVLAEELDVEIVGAGRSTLRRSDFSEGVEADSSFYIANQARMVGRTEINLPEDPPPDLAIEVEVTHRLGERKSIYQDLGVPEIWVYRVNEGLQVLLRQPDGSYARSDESLAFSLLSPEQISDFVRAGVLQGQIAFTKAFRQHVRETLKRIDAQ